MTAWGPQHAADLPGGLRIGHLPGRYWWAVATVAAVCLLVSIESSGWVISAVLVASALGVGIGLHEGHGGIGFANGRWVAFASATILFPVIGIGYSAAYFGVRHGPRLAAARRAAIAARWEAAAHAEAATEPTDWPVIAGGFFGLNDAGQPVTANPRGASLVIGPPGSGKTSCVVEPSVALAPGPCVSTSIKTEVMTATASIRAQRGTCWWFDPGGAGGVEPPPGVQQLRWNPLVDVVDWPAAMAVASRLTGPFRSADGGSSSDHWIDKAEQWLATYLYSATLGRGLDTLADWCRGPAAAADEVAAGLLEAEVLRADRGAHFANSVLAGIMATEAKERSSIASTLSRITKLYNNPLALDAGSDPNFDAREFVRSTADTVYITAPSSMQADYGPLIAGLLESIRTAQEMRRQRVDRGEETQDVPVTFILDEAANTAPIPLPAIASTAGGQGLHLVVAVQEPNQVRARWGQAGDGFLTMFPDKLILSGMADDRWATMLSKMSGEYDRMTANVSAGSRARQQRTGLLFDVQTGSSDADPAISYSTQRTAQLSVADITTLPAGRALMFGRAGWKLIHLRPFDASRPLGADNSQRASAPGTRPAYLGSGPSWLAQRATPKRLLIAAAAAILVIGGGLIAALTGHHEPGPTPLPPPASTVPLAQPSETADHPQPQWDAANPDILAGYWTSPTDCGDHVTMWVIEDHDSDAHTVTLRTGCFTQAWADAIKAQAALFVFSVPMDGQLALLDPKGVFEAYGRVGPLQLVQLSDREGCGDSGGQLHPGPIAYDCVYHRLTQ